MRVIAYPKTERTVSVGFVLTKTQNVVDERPLIVTSYNVNIHNAYAMMTYVLINFKYWTAAAEKEFDSFDQIVTVWSGFDRIACSLL
jgi:hypothetical protein